MSKIVAVITCLATVGTICMLLLYGATFYAIGKSQERVACYKRMQSVEACEPPDLIERAVRKLAGTP